MRSAPLFEPDPFEGVLGPTVANCGQLWPETNPKQPKTKTEMIIFHRGLAATKYKLVWFGSSYGPSMLPGFLGPNMKPSPIPGAGPASQTQALSGQTSLLQLYQSLIKTFLFFF